MLETAILFIFSVIILFGSGTVLVRTLVWMGRYLGISEYVLAFVLVSFVTTLPELFVGLSAALSHTPILSLGNVVGSSVLDIALVLGGVIIIGRGMRMNHVVSREDVTLAFGVLMLPVLLLLDGVLSRGDGFLLILFFLGYIYYLGSRGRVSRAFNQAEAAEYRFGKFLKMLGFFLAGIAALLVSSWLVVETGRNLALAAGLSVFFVGILIGFGTTLPELVFGATAVMLKRSPLSLGNVVGSILTKSTFVLGVVSLINPVLIKEPLRAIGGLVLAAVLIAIIQFIASTQNYLPRALGYFLLVLGAAFLLVEAVL